MIERFSILAKIIIFFKQVKTDFMEGYNDGRTRSDLGWKYNLKQWRKKK